MDRYSRQTILPEIGPEGQARLSRASVLCIGAGGLGAPALLYLAAAGVGRIGIADFDVVDESNLQRQVLFSAADAGTPKVEAARERLAALNPDIQIDIYPEGLTAENAERLFGAYDIILDGTDNFTAKYLINDAGVKFGKPVVYGAIYRFAGQVSVFDAMHGPCYRCLYPQPPEEEILNCAEAGVIGAVAGLVGVTQAMQALMLAAPHDSFAPLIGRLWTVDTKTMETKILSLKKDPACPVCSKAAEDIVLDYDAPVCGAVREIAPEDLDAHPGALVIDVREDYEWAGGHIEGAQHFALSGLLNGAQLEAANDQELILYCEHGVRSFQAAQMLKAQGFAKVGHLTGGYAAYKSR